MLIPVPETCLARFRSAPEPRLVKAAGEFEAQMMKELLQPLVAGGSGDEEPGGALAMFAGEALGRGLSDRGGFGIARKLVTQLSDRTPVDEQAPAHANPGDREMAEQIKISRMTKVISEPADHMEKSGRGL